LFFATEEATSKNEVVALIELTKRRYNNGAYINAVVIVAVVREGVFVEFNASQNVKRFIVCVSQQRIRETFSRRDQIAVELFSE
jgi:hypothetical protein